MMGKFESWWITLRNMAGGDPEIASVIAALFAVAAMVLIRARPGMRDAFVGWLRISKYCHTCQFFDPLSEDCSIRAISGAKCGLIDKSAGMSFSVKKDTPD